MHLNEYLFNRTAPAIQRMVLAAGQQRAPAGSHHLPGVCVD
jgi:hypothetical protein